MISLAFGQFGQEFVIVLPDFTLLASNKPYNFIRWTHHILRIMFSLVMYQLDMSVEMALLCCLILMGTSLLHGPT